MKVTELRSELDESASVTLHDHVTIVQPADPPRRTWVLHAVGLIAQDRGVAVDDVVVGAAALPGHDPAMAALVQARDVALTTREQAITRLKDARADLTRAIDERSRIAADLEAVIHGEGAARDAVAAHQAERSRCEAELDAARRQREASEATLAAAVEQRTERQRSRDAAVAALEGATARRRTAVDAAVAAAAAVESARSLTASGPDPSTLLAEARQRLVAAEAEADAADPDHDESPLNRRLADLERHRVHLVRRLTATGDSAAVAVDEALAVVLVGDDDAPPLAEAMALADTWRDLHQQIDALDLGVSDEERAAATDLVLARRALAEADIVANQPLLTPEQIAKVEGAHQAVLEAQDRSEARFGGSRARKRLEDLRSDERRVLERLGFSTYADYMMSSSSRNMSSSRKSVEVARTSLLAAQERHDAIPGASDRTRRRAELVDRRDEVAAKIAAMLGHEPTGPEAEDELRVLRGPADADHEALELLAAALGAAGIDVGPSPFERDDLVLLARAYLAEDRRAEAERVDLEDAIRAVDEAVIHLRAARDTGAVDVPDDLVLPPLAEPDGAHDDADQNLREARWAAVEQARALVEEAEARSARHDGIHDELTALQEALAAASRREREAADQLVAAEAMVAGAGDVAELEQAANAVAEAEAALARSRSAEAAAAAAVAALGGTGSEALQTEHEAALKAAEALVTEAVTEEQEAVSRLEQADADLGAATDAAEVAEAATAGLDRAALVDDIDWALLNRLAALRGDHGTGPVPLVLDEPFGALQDDEVIGVLERLSRFAPLAQIVVVSHRPAVVDWALSAGPDRVAVVPA